MQTPRREKRNPLHRTHHGHHRDTIGALLEDLAEHAELVNQTLLVNLGLSQYEMDEFWTTIKKNRKRLSITAQLQLKKVVPTSTLQ
jgi:hypothetical protein